jgi:hypothetical protein
MFHTCPYQFCTLELLIYPEDAGIRFFEMILTTHRTTWCHITEEVYTVWHFQVNQYISV